MDDRADGEVLRVRSIVTDGFGELEAHWYAQVRTQLRTLYGLERRETRRR